LRLLSGLGLSRTEIKDKLELQLKNVIPSEDDIPIWKLSSNDLIDIIEYQTDIQMSLALAPLHHRIESLESLVHSQRREIENLTSGRGADNLRKLDRLLTRVIQWENGRR
jgi:hypothetical protein